MNTLPVAIAFHEIIGNYGFAGDHPFSTRRFAAFWEAMRLKGLDYLLQFLPVEPASEEDLLRFHPRPYLERVKALSSIGEGYLDAGDTPVFPDMFQISSMVVGAAITAAKAIMGGSISLAFVPIGGLHHGYRDHAAGFCVFNDIAVVIEFLRQRYNLQRILYVDIDAHHGDGVYYSYVEDPNLIIVDIHEDGRFLYPGTGALEERGTGPAQGTKINIPLQPGAKDEDFFLAWEQAVRFMECFTPEFIIFQCGVDGLRGDPLTHLHYTSAAHEGATRFLIDYAKRKCQERMLVLGGGGYRLENIASGWTAVLKVMLEES